MEARTFVAAVALLATTILLQSSLVAATANAHVVGGSTGWTIPPNTSFYSDWSSSQTITAGDTLVFNFPTGFHTVAEVPKSSFDSCSTTKQIGSTLNNGPATVTVTSGTHYYICSILGHCSAGMKLALTVAAPAIAPSVSAAPTPASKASAPTPASPAPAVAPKVAGPTSSTPVPAAAPVSRSPAPTAVPKVAGPTASSPAPTSDKKSAASPTGSVSTVPSSTANPPAAPGPSNSSPALPGAAGMAVALLTAATVSFLL